MQTTDAWINATFVVHASSDLVLQVSSQICTIIVVLHTVMLLTTYVHIHTKSGYITNKTHS